MEIKTQILILLKMKLTLFVIKKMNINISIIDSNIFISFFSKNIKYLEIKEILKKGAYLNNYIFCETLNFLQNKLSIFQSIQAQKHIIKNNQHFIFLPFNENLLKQAELIRDKYYNNQFAFTDALILAQAEFYNLKVYTRDMKMQNYINAKVINPIDYQKKS